MNVEIIVVENLFPEIAGRIDGANRTALDAGGQAALSAADAVTRVRTGDLKANKQTENDGQTWTNTWLMYYAIYQDFGTYKMSGTHFGEAGIDAAAPAYLSAFTGALGL